MADRYDIAAIRRLLMEAFTAEDLLRFCQDEPALEPVTVRFGPGQGLDDMVAEVINYCKTHRQVAALLEAVERANPAQYAHCGPYLLPPAAVQAPGRLRDLARTPWPWLAGALVVGLILLAWRPWSGGGAAPTPAQGSATAVTIAPSAIVTTPPAAATDTPTPTGTPSPTPSGTATYTPTPSGTPTYTPTPSDTPTHTPTPSPTANTGLGTFTTQFSAKTPLVVAKGLTLGSTYTCLFYHNLSLGAADTGKLLSVEVRNLFVQGYEETLSLELYRSYIGPVRRGGSLDLYHSPQAEEVLATSKREFTWQVTSPGDYVICLAAEYNLYPEIQPGSAVYTVLLRGR